MKFLLSIFITVILILVSQRAEVQAILMFGSEKMKASMRESLKRQRGNAPTPLELLVVVYVLGFVWQETQEIFYEGVRSYLRNLWNFIDFTRNALYCVVFVLRGIAYFQQISQITQNPSTAFVPREQWDDFDPQLIVNIARRKTIALIMIDFFRHFFVGCRQKDFLRPQTFSQLLSSFICSQLILIWGPFKSLLDEWLLTLSSFSSSTH